MPWGKTITCHFFVTYFQDIPGKQFAVILIEMKKQDPIGPKGGEYVSNKKNNII